MFHYIGLIRFDKLFKQAWMHMLLFTKNELWIILDEAAVMGSVIVGKSTLY